MNFMSQKLYAGLNKPIISLSFSLVRKKIGTLDSASLYDKAQYICIGSQLLKTFKPNPN